MIIHISGSPGSGKTTLGEKIQEQYGDKVLVYDTDDFIQHHNHAGKKLLELNTASIDEYKKVWLHILQTEINNYIKKHKNKIIIFTGILDNFSPDGTIYELKSDYKFLLNTPLNVILERYYLRICKDENNRTIEDSIDYWNKLANGIYNINSSNEIIVSYKRDIEWHKQHNYLSRTENEIMDLIGKIVNTTEGKYHKKYKKYRTKYMQIKNK